MCMYVCPITKIIPLYFNTKSEYYNIFSNVSFPRFYSHVCKFDCVSDFQSIFIAERKIKEFLTKIPTRHTTRPQFRNGIIKLKTIRSHNRDWHNMAGFLFLTMLNTWLHSVLCWHIDSKTKIDMHTFFLSVSLVLSLDVSLLLKSHGHLTLF
jgi:hypothetical protein